MNEQQQGERVLRRLRIVQWAAWIDLILLVALLASSFSKQRDFVHVLGPLHGINFLLLIAIVGTAALDGLWGLWFPLVVLLTAGAPGALIGEWIIKRRIQSQPIGDQGETIAIRERTGALDAEPLNRIERPQHERTERKEPI